MTIRFSCPKCQSKLNAPDEKAGVKVPCPKCGQRLLIPTPPPPENKTLLGELEPPPLPAPTVLGKLEPEPLAYVPVEVDDILDVLPASPIVAVPIVIQPVPPPGQGNVPRSPYRDEGVGFQCPYCKTRALPRIRSDISQTGWIVFIVLILSCFPLCWVALFIKEEYRVCSACGIRLG